MSEPGSDSHERIAIDIRSVDGVTVVALGGDLDANTSRSVRARVLPLVQPGGRFIMDLSRLQYMSSAGLRVLLSLYRHTSNQDGRLVLVGLSTEIRETMEVTGFMDFFTACPTLQDALRALGVVS